MNEHETIADIIAEMHEYAQVCRVENWNTPPETERHYTEDDVDDLAERLEAAHRRERGDCAKLHEAMIDILEYIESFHKYITPDKGEGLTALFAVADTIRSKARAALATISNQNT